MAQQPEHPQSAKRYKAASAAVAVAGAAAATGAAGSAGTAVAGGATLAAAKAIFRYQYLAAKLADRAVREMLRQQNFTPEPEFDLVPEAFTTGLPEIQEMLMSTSDIDRLASSLIQEAGRAAQQVALAVEPPKVGWIRMLTLPSCSRCAVLAGRIYRWSEGFRRHPNCDCVMVPITVGNTDMVYDLKDLTRTGQIHGLSKADRRAILDGADFNQVVNVQSRKAGLIEAGHVITRGGRLTPAGIYQQAGDDRDLALKLLRSEGYIR